MTGKYYKHLTAFFLFACLMGCKKSAEPAPQAIEGTYLASGLFVSIGTFNDTIGVAEISPGVYEANFHEFGDTSFIDWKFTFQIDSTTNGLINWHAEGNTYPEPQSGFMTIVNPTNDPKYPGSPFTDPPYSNVYDPTTKTFWMHYGYGAGTSNENQYSREIFEKLVLK